MDTHTSAHTYKPLKLHPSFRYWKENRSADPPRKSYARRFDILVPPDTYARIYKTSPGLACCVGSSSDFSVAVSKAHEWAIDNGVDLGEVSIDEFIYCRASKSTLAEQQWRYGREVRGWYLDVTSIQKRRADGQWASQANRMYDEKASAW